MNHLIIFILVIVMCFGSKKTSGCSPNTLQFKNQLTADHTLVVLCKSNRGEHKDYKYVQFNEIYNFPVVEKGKIE